MAIRVVFSLAALLLHRKSDVRNVNKYLPFARAFTENESPGRINLSTNKNEIEQQRQRI